MNTISRYLDAIVRFEIARQEDCGSSAHWAFGQNARAIYNECLWKFKHEDILARASVQYSTYLRGGSHYDMAMGRRCMMFILNNLTPKPVPEEKHITPDITPKPKRGPWYRRMMRRIRRRNKRRK